MPLESGSAETPIPNWCGNPRGIAEGSVTAGGAVAMRIQRTSGSTQIRRITVNVSATGSVPRDELEPVPERILDIEAALPLEVHVARDLDAVLPQAALQLVEA